MFPLFLGKYEPGSTKYKCADNYQTHQLVCSTKEECVTMAEDICDSDPKCFGVMYNAISAFGAFLSQRKLRTLTTCSSLKTTNIRSSIFDAFTSAGVVTYMKTRK